MGYQLPQINNTYQNNAIRTRHIDRRVQTISAVTKVFSIAENRRPLWNAKGLLAGGHTRHKNMPDATKLTGKGNHFDSRI